MLSHIVSLEANGKSELKKKTWTQNGEFFLLWITF